MANRRDLKKNINYITTVLTGLCAMDAVNATQEKKQAYYHVFIEIAQLRDDLISRVSHTEPGNVKGFYKKLNVDLQAGVEKISAKMEELAK